MSDIQLPAAGLAEDVLRIYGQEKKELQIVAFSLGEEYGVPIGQVLEIVRVGDITMVPNSPPYVEGVINLRGRVLPVMNLRKRLNLAPGEIKKASRVIVTEIGSKVIGILVDGVSHVIKVPCMFVEAAPEEVMEVDTDFIQGVAKLRGRLIILLDLEKLLRGKAVSTDQGVAAE